MEQSFCFTLRIYIQNLYTTGYIILDPAVTEHVYQILAYSVHGSQVETCGRTDPTAL